MTSKANKSNKGPMAASLQDLQRKMKSQMQSNHNIKDPAPSAMRWKADGEDHINITDNAATDLGKALAHNSTLPFNHHIFGQFCNMESFWYYMQSAERDDRIRAIFGTTLKNFAKKLTPVTVVNFKAIIMDANYQRICAYAPLMDAMKESTLPFDCYFVNDAGIRIRRNLSFWLTKGFEEIRTALKEDRDPDFSFLLDRGNSSIYQFVVPKDSSCKDFSRFKTKETTKEAKVEEAA